jgi:ketosteroid isomerase-like protein
MRREETAMTHPTEKLLLDLYARLSAGDLEAFLAGCTEDVIFSMPGKTEISGTWSKGSYKELLEPIIEQSQGRYLVYVLAVAANDEHGILMLFQRFLRDGGERQYRTAHHVTLRDGLISACEEMPGSAAEFKKAWSRQIGRSRLRGRRSGPVCQVAV